MMVLWWFMVKRSQGLKRNTQMALVHDDFVFASPTLGHKLEILQRLIQLCGAVDTLMWQNTYTGS